MQNWNLLTDRLSALEKQEILENRAEEKLRLHALIEEARTQRDQVEQELKARQEQLVSAELHPEAAADQRDDPSRSRTEDDTGEIKGQDDHPGQSGSEPGRPGKLTWLFAWWSSQTLFRRQILIGLLLGVSLGLGLHYLHAQLTVLRAVDDLAMDLLLRLQWSTPISQPALSFVLLDIDDQTYQAWKTPSPVPRDRLLKLIQ